VSRQFAGVTAVFDLDGTIADTAHDLAAAAQAALGAEGFPPAPQAAIVKCAGQGARAMLRAALAATGSSADTAQMQRMAGMLHSHYESNIANKSRLFPGFMEAGQVLRVSGAKLVLCTNKGEGLARKLLAALGAGEVFDAVAGGDTFPFKKPDPRHLLELIRLAGGVPRKSVMVGDSETDVEAANGAGIPIIVTAFGYASRHASELGASAVLDHFDELPALIGALLAATRDVDCGAVPA
jgi:phosphoglycolate phosphatase